VASVRSGGETFSLQDLRALAEAVAASWTAAADHDWSVPAGTVEWSCLATADHAVDCVYAPAVFLASRRVDAYPPFGLNMMLGTDATPALLVESLQLAVRLLAGVVVDADPGVEAILFRRPEAITGAPRDFPPRAALELILHAHDVARGLDVAFAPPADLCHHLREHTRPWPLWTLVWSAPGSTDDPWADLLVASGREPAR
jgi:hypothetical protein